MAHYLVTARPRAEKLEELRRWLDTGEIGRMRPFGPTLQGSLENARRHSEGTAVWEEEDYCRPPLAQERKAVLDHYFDSIEVEPVEKGEGWARIADQPRIWEDQ